jgi:hypothetical protein
VGILGTGKQGELLRMFETHGRFCKWGWIVRYEEKEMAQY